MKSYTPKLNSDFFLDPGNNKQSDISNDELSGAHSYLINKKFRSLLRDLDSMTFVPLSSDGLKRTFHRHGVNIRYLGDLVGRTALPHVSMFMISEMVARCSSKVLAKFTSHFALETGFAQPNIDLRGLSREEIDQTKNNLMTEFDFDLRGMTVHFLNLTISNTIEANKYWDKYIVPQCEYDFGYLLPLIEKKEAATEPLGINLNYKKSDIPVGMLCSACFHHFNVKMRDRMYTNHPEENSFTAEDLLDFKVAGRSFWFGSIKIFEILESHHQLLADGQSSLALQLVKIKTELHEMLENQYETFGARIDLIDAHLKLGDYDTSLVECRAAVNKAGPFSLESCRLLLIQLKIWILKQNRAKIEDTFRLASALVVYNLGEHHPLHATLRSFMA